MPVIFTPRGCPLAYESLRRKSGFSHCGVLAKGFSTMNETMMAVWCGVCPACRQGAENLCQDMRIMGFHRHGGFAQWVAAPEKSLIPIPEGLPWEEAVFAEPLSCCLNALEKAGPLQGKKVAVWGSGPAGILLCRAARAAGAEVWSIEPDPVRRKKFGGCRPVPDESFDLCVPAVGQTSAYEEALSYLAPHGCLVVFSGLSRGKEILPLAHPLRPNCAVRGGYAAECLDKVRAVMQRVGYRRGLVVYGWDREKQRGMDEISILGETEVREFGPDGYLREYTLRPGDFGIQPVGLEAVAGSGNLEREAERFLQVLAGINHQACSDFTCLNAGAAFYIAGLTPTLKEGVEESREIIRQGQALKKMEEWVFLQQDPDHNGQRRFESLARRAGVDLSS